MLTVAVEGSGSVTTASPGPEFPAIECGNGATTCEGQYNKDTTLVLIATPSSYNHFASWGAGECEVANANECTITMNAAKSVRADFLPTMHKLTVIRSGPGSITSLPSGISCGEDQCQAEFQEGSTVTLIAHPDTHNRLAGWTGGVCAGEPSPSECEVEIGASNVHVKGEFAPIQHTLRVVSDGGGSVTASSGGISGCAPGRGVCAAQYVEASTVALTASPFSHSTFHAWTGCTHSSGNTCEVEIGLGTTEVKAEFAPNEHTLTVSPTGPGSVTASSGSIRGCESAGGNCAGEYIEAFALTLTATPAPHQAVAWSGCTHSSEDTCEVEIGSSDQGVEANFSEITYTLGLTQAGTGKGTIACNGSPCASSYPEGTRLTLNASPAAGSTFVGWSGGGCSGIGPCELNLERRHHPVRHLHCQGSPPDRRALCRSLASRQDPYPGPLRPHRRQLHTRQGGQAQKEGSSRRQILLTGCRRHTARRKQSELEVGLKIKEEKAQKPLMSVRRSDPTPGEITRCWRWAVDEMPGCVICSRTAT